MPLSEKHNFYIFNPYNQNVLDLQGHYVAFKAGATLLLKFLIVNSESNKGK